MARVLLVEDDPRIRDLTVLRLQVDGHHVVTAVDAAEAVAASRSGPRFDLVAVSVLLSGEGSVARVLDALREAGPACGVPVATYLAYSTTMAVKSLSLGDAASCHGQPLMWLLSAINTLNRPGYATAS
jgi:CheY-like chemotaxis protein